MVASVLGVFAFILTAITIAIICACCTYIWRGYKYSNRYKVNLGHPFKELPGFIYAEVDRKEDDIWEFPRLSIEPICILGMYHFYYP